MAQALPQPREVELHVRDSRSRVGQDGAVLVPLLSGLLVVLLIAVFFVGARRPARIELDVRADDLVLRIHGKDAFYALSRGLTVPLTAVRGIAVARTKDVPKKGMRLPGTEIPRVLRAGSYGTGARRDFWLVRRAEDVLVVELEPGQPYRRIVIEVPDPRELCRRLQPRGGCTT